MTSEASKPSPKKGSKGPNFQKPNQEAYKRSLDEIDAAISKLREKQTEFTREIDDLMSGKKGDKDPRGQIRNQLAKLRDEQGSLKSNRQTKFDEMNNLQSSLKRKTTSLKALQTKMPFKTLVELEEYIEKLERQVESGKLKIIEEKKVLSEISALKRNKKSFDAIHELEDSISEDRERLDLLRTQVDEARNNEINKEYDALKEKLEDLNVSQTEVHSARAQLIEKRDQIKRDIDAQYDMRRSVMSKFKEANNMFYEGRREEMKRRQEEAVLLKKKEEEAKLEELIEIERANASIPSFQHELAQCSTLLTYLGKLVPGGIKLSPTEQVNEATNSASTTNAVREIDANNVPKGTALTKKADRDDVYFMATSKNKKNSKKNAKSNSAASTSSASKDGSLTLPLAIVEALWAVKVSPPSSNSDLPSSIQNIKDRMQHYRDNQEKATQDKKAKAELKIKALKAKYQTSVPTKDEKIIEEGTVPEAN